MHRTDVVPELAGRRSISLVARSKKLKLSSPRASHARLPSDRLINQSRADNALVIGIVPNSSKLAGWSTSPRACSGRCCPQISELADWATSPRAHSARWSVQSPDLQTGRLGDQSPSIRCSVVGAVPRNVDPPPIFVCYFEKSILPHKWVTWRDLLTHCQMVAWKGAPGNCAVALCVVREKETINYTKPSSRRSKSAKFKPSSRRSKSAKRNKLIYATMSDKHVSCLPSS